MNIKSNRKFKVKSHFLQSQSQTQGQNQHQKSKVASFDVLESCPDNSEVIHLLLDKVCVIKLNGGLGTSMGCRGPKSAIETTGCNKFLLSTNVGIVENLINEFNNGFIYFYRSNHNWIL